MIELTKAFYLLSGFLVGPNATAIARGKKVKATQTKASSLSYLLKSHPPTHPPTRGVGQDKAPNPPQTRMLGALGDWS